MYLPCDRSVIYGGVFFVFVYMYSTDTFIFVIKNILKSEHCEFACLVL